MFARGSSLTLDRCVLSQNSSKRGSGVYCVEGSSAAIDSCTFDTNTAVEGGGGFFGDHMVSLSVTHTDFTNNRTQLTSQPNAGGGFYCRLADSFEMEDCSFTGNVCAGDVGSGDGVFYVGCCPVNITRCDFSGNSAGRGGGASLGQAIFADCEFTNNTAVTDGGGLFGGDALIRCSVSGNHAGSRGGGSYFQGSSILIEDCMFNDNTAILTGGGSLSVRPTDLVRSTFHDNSASVGGAVYLQARGDNALTDCTLYDNSAALGAGVHVDSLQIPEISTGVTTITGCTIASNAGSGASLEWAGVISRSIIAFGESGAAVACSGPEMPALSCTDIFGNAGGDWTACIVDQLGINGNFAANPRFCAPLSGDFTLAQDSPCAPAHSPAGCGTIGSQPVGCVSPIGIADAGAPPVAPGLRILPNPLRTAGVIEWTASVETFTLYDTSGRLVARHELDPGARTARGHLAWQDFLSGKRLAPGVYFLRSLAPTGVKLADETVVVLP